MFYSESVRKVDGTSLTIKREERGLLKGSIFWRLRVL